MTRKPFPKDAAVPETVKCRVQDTLHTIQMNSATTTPEHAKVISYRKNFRARLTALLVACAVLLCGISAFAALRLREKLGITTYFSTSPELAETLLQTPQVDPITQNGITVSLSSCIVDGAYSFFSFCVDGLKIAAETEPAFEEIQIMLIDTDGTELDVLNMDAAFYNGSPELGTPEIFLDENQQAFFQMALWDALDRDINLDGKMVRIKLSGMGHYEQKLEYTEDSSGIWEFCIPLHSTDIRSESFPERSVGFTGFTLTKTILTPLTAELQYAAENPENIKYAPIIYGVRMEDDSVLKNIYGGGLSGGYTDDTHIRIYKKMSLRIAIDPSQVSAVLLQQPDSLQIYEVSLK